MVHHGHEQKNHHLLNNQLPPELVLKTNTLWQILKIHHNNKYHHTSQKEIPISTSGIELVFGSKF